MKIYLDANVFYFSLYPDDDRCIEARNILRRIAKGGFKAYTCALAIDEFVWSVWKKSKDKQIATNEGLKILSLSNLELISVDKEIIFNSLKIMGLYSLKPRDAIHLAAMLSKNIKVIVSDDRDFDKIKEIKRKSLN